MKKRILTGLQATGEHLHIGNYFGSIKYVLDYQNGGEYETFLMLANMHSLSGFYDADKIRQYSMNILKLYVACGIDPSKTIIFNQAMIPAHAQLARVLQCITNMGTAERMHGYKDAINKGKAGEISVGVFTYPILMAADILLYDIDTVPVGKDQKQHVEYARDIAEKFNKLFGEIFKIPAPKIDENVAVVPGIDGRKMSKSYNNYIGLMDDEKTVLKKVKIISTDTKGVDEAKNPDESNLYQIMKLFLTPEEDEKIRSEFINGGRGYGSFKEELAQKITTFLAPIQERYNSITDADIIKMVEESTPKANAIAQAKIEDVYKKVGFIL
ncbi:tryptophan--tRNA ligase [Patescibacteria group bacterium]|nr:tryptophan--tRNA ligase [Patescibacteria group bacterium]